MWVSLLPFGNPPGRSSYLDALRGVAFLNVMAVHVSGHMTGLPNWVLRLCNAGNYGVQLFFILSALTLCMSMHNRRASEHTPVLGFAIRRLFRIVPMYWVSMIFYIIFLGRGPTHFAPDGIGLTQILTNLFFIHGWYPTTINSVVPGGWSIAVEMNFYLLFPFLFLYLYNIKRAVVAIMIYAPVSIVISVSLFRLFASGLNDISPELLREFFYYWLPRQIVVFILGFALFHGLKDDRVGCLRRRTGACVLLGGIPSFGIILLSNLPAEYLVLSLLYAAIIFSLAICPTRLIVNPLLRYTGLISYSAYLTHFAVVEAISNILEPVLRDGCAPVVRFGVVYIACWMLTLVVATVTYRLIELPCQHIGKWLNSKIGASQDRSAPAPVI